MSNYTIEPANQICYIEKPPKPLGTAISDFIKEQAKPAEIGKSRLTSGAPNSPTNASAPPIAVANHIGQITGRLINTTA